MTGTRSGATYAARSLEVARRPATRWAAASVLAGLAAVLIASVTLAAWSQRVLLDEDRFSGRIAATLERDEVNRYLAGTLTEQVVARVPELITVRPAVEAVLSEALRTRTAIVAARAALRDAHRGVRSGIAEKSVILDLDAVLTLARALMERGAPDIAERFTAGLDTTFLDSAAIGLRTDVFSRLERLSSVSLPLALIGVLAVGGTVLVAPGRRGGALLAASGIAGAGVLGLLSQRLTEAWLANRILTSSDAGQAFALAWDALLVEYRAWNLGLLALGLALAVGALASGRLPRRQEVAAMLLASAWGRGAGGAGLLVVGVAIARWPLDTVRVLVIAAGAIAATTGLGLLLQGLRSSFSGLGGLRTGLGAASRVRNMKAIVVAFMATSILGAVVLIATWVESSVTVPPLPPVPREVILCNGSAALCDRPLNDVTFAATHNSMAAASQRGWYFPSQRYGVAQQLRDGVRGLLIDTYYGVPSPQGVRTVIPPGVRREELVERYREEVVAAAERIGTRLSEGGEQALFACHSFCELGATPLGALLVDLRDYLDANPGDFVIVIVQDSTSPEDTVRAFEAAGLAERAYAHPRGDAAWPTLRTLLDDGKQLLVLAENRAGDAADWYQPAFALTQETPAETLRTEDFSCARGRGVTDAPFFVLNHWLASSAPLPAQALEVNRYELLIERVRTCAEERGKSPNLIAVNFHDSGDLFRVVDELNSAPRSRGAPTPTPRPTSGTPTPGEVGP